MIRTLIILSLAVARSQAGEDLNAGRCTEQCSGGEPIGENPYSVTCNTIDCDYQLPRECKLSDHDILIGISSSVNMHKAQFEREKYAVADVVRAMCQQVQNSRKDPRKTRLALLIYNVEPFMYIDFNSGYSMNNCERFVRKLLDVEYQYDGKGTDLCRMSFLSRETFRAQGRQEAKRSLVLVGDGEHTSKCNTADDIKALHRGVTAVYYLGLSNKLEKFDDKVAMKFAKQKKYLYDATDYSNLKDVLTTLVENLCCDEFEIECSVHTRGGCAGESGELSSRTTVTECEMGSKTVNITQNIPCCVDCQESDDDCPEETFVPKVGQEFRIFSNRTNQMLIKTNALKVEAAEQKTDNDKDDASWWTLTEADDGKFYITLARSDLRMYFNSNRKEFGLTTSRGSDDQLFNIIPSTCDSSFRLIGIGDCKIFLRTQKEPYTGGYCNEKIYGDQFFKTFTGQS